MLCFCYKDICVCVCCAFACSLSHLPFSQFCTTNSQFMLHIDLIHQQTPFGMCVHWCHIHTYHIHQTDEQANKQTLCVTNTLVSYTHKNTLIHCWTHFCCHTHTFKSPKRRRRRRRRKMKKNTNNNKQANKLLFHFILYVRV